MKRILVLGSSGSGKYTFSRQLGERLGIEAISLDSHFWEPHWIGM
jgi:adenylate kinase family enzyme